MTPSETSRVVAQADRLCDEVIARPDDHKAREALFAALAPLVDVGFVADEPQRGLLLHGLARQAATLATILRQRIDDGRSGRYSDSLIEMHVGVGARDLKRALSLILRHLGSADD